jgi:hypothetical protein
MKSHIEKLKEKLPEIDLENNFHKPGEPVMPTIPPAQSVFNIFMRGILGFN